MFEPGVFSVLAYDLAKLRDLLNDAMLRVGGEPRTYKAMREDMQVVLSAAYETVNDWAGYLEEKLDKA
jgi:hypothetical protein